MEIQAAVVSAQGGAFEIESLQLAEPRADEVVVRIAGVGVCHTDLVCRDQYFPVPLPCVFGHEGSGVVHQVGEAVTRVQPGDHVVLSYSSCQACSSCLAGKPAYCHSLYQYNFLGTRVDGTSALSRNGKSMHGHFFAQSSFSTFAMASERNVVKVPEDVPLWLLGPLGCGVQTGAGAVINSLQPRAGSAIAVFGAGTVGLSAIMAARLSGCAVIIAVDPVAARRRLAQELGATHVIDPSRDNVIEAIRNITGTGVNYSLECTGLPAVVRQAVDSLTLTGMCGLIGVSRLGTEITLDMNGILFGRGVRGIIEGDSVPQEFIPKLIELYRQGRFPFEKLITPFDFAQIEQAVAASERGEVVKAVLKMPGV
ncbi:MAG TPA: NAD(P)-dependent alcohol dehydrogenase [Steroidobacter sp.]|uniref:NAD(P)-dependent alcohol dehydrogenase n=1 Tax=Steroidobacter sp. TaxID=1978227 RepID=UPI002EDA2F0D